MIPIAALSAPPNATVVEYYRSDVDHYFMTASPQEQALLDDGTTKGWMRTGVTFLAWTSAAIAPPTAQPVCRYYGKPEAGLDSHFYSAFSDECAAVSVNFPNAWQFEAPDVFYIEAPDRTNGTCPANTDPVSRVYDNRRDANHRYILSPQVRATMLGRGWILEGYGNDAVVMCAPRPNSSADDVALADATSYLTTPTGSIASAVDAAAVTYHAATVGGTTIPYKATTGHLVVSDPRSGRRASFFYVAYTAQGTDAGTRPVTFFYNGGPGSASIWLHLGSFGPKRLATGVPSTSLPRPFPLVDNNESMLDISDLVFVDAIGTGLSTAIAPATNRNFWGVDLDASAFQGFVQRYVEANGRAASPKFLFGESYGTTRTAVLANMLEMGGTPLAGIVLQSSVLNYNTNCGVVTATLSCAGYLPTYAVTAVYYQLVVPQPNLPGFRTEVQNFSVTTYDPAVITYLPTRMLPDASVLDALYSFTSIPQTGWQANFNLGPDTFQRQLVSGTLLGRYDARVSAPIGSPLASTGDPSDALVSGSFTNAIYDYLRVTLKYTWPNTYVGLSNAIYSWDFSHDGQPLPDTVPDLATALTLNPRLKVLSVNGYHDLATPYFQTMLDLARIAGPRIQIRNYDGGHMTYLDDVSRPLLKADLRAFYRSATAP